MANKTLIRSQKKHEVKLSEGSQLAQSRKPHEETGALPVPPLIRKGTSSKRASAAPSPRTASPSAPRTTPARKKAKLVGEAAPAKTPKATRSPRDAAAKAPGPRLPAFVPADGLWEADSAVMQRLQALAQRNAQLSEQLQRIQNNPLPKGREP